jgi:hypothetical protein
VPEKASTSVKEDSITVEDIISATEPNPEVKATLNNEESAAIEIPFDEPSEIVTPSSEPIIEEIPKEKDILKEELKTVEDINIEETTIEETHKEAAPVKEIAIEEVEKPKLVEDPIQEEPVKEQSIAEEKIETVESTNFTKIQISIGDKYEFINAVFKKDAVVYKSTLENLNTLKSLETSMKVIGEIQEKNNLQDDNETLERFVKLIEKRYA